MNIVKAIQIGANVTDILKLPCVKSVHKCDDKQGFEWLEYHLTDGSICEESDWLCKDTEGNWSVLSDIEYFNQTHDMP